MASSRWNRAAGPEAALCRLSEVFDWEEGGRTGVEHTARVFEREVQEGERRVLVVRQQVGLQVSGFCIWSSSCPPSPCPATSHRHPG